MAAGRIFPVNERNGVLAERKLAAPHGNDAIAGHVNAIVERDHAAGERNDPIAQRNDPIAQRNDLVALFSLAFEAAAAAAEDSVLRYAVARIQSLDVSA